MRGVLPLAALACLLAGALIAGVGRFLTIEALLEARQALTAFVDARGLLAAGAYVLAYAAAVAVSVPGATLLTVAGGLLFGGWLGGALAVAGATAGATLLFLAARTSLGQALARRAGPGIAHFQSQFQKDAVSYLLFLRLVSLFPFWLVNLALAATGVRAWTFAWTTFVGILPATFAFALAGAGLGSIADARRAAYDACLAAGSTDCRLAIAPGDLVTRETLVAIAALGVMALIPVVLRRLRRDDPKAPGRNPHV